MIESVRGHIDDYRTDCQIELSFGPCRLKHFRYQKPVYDAPLSVISQVCQSTNLMKS